MSLGIFCYLLPTKPRHSSVQVALLGLPSCSACAVRSRIRALPLSEESSSDDDNGWWQLPAQLSRRDALWWESQLLPLAMCPRASQFLVVVVCVCWLTSCRALKGFICARSYSQSPELNGQGMCQVCDYPST